MDRFHPPGFVDDFERRPDSAEDRAKGWHAVVSAWMDGSVRASGTADIPSLFFNPLKDETPGEPASEVIAWDAFPRFLTRWFRDDDEPDEQRWLAAETLRPLRIGGRALRRVDDEGFLGEELQLFYRQQDEYCEWHADRDGEGRITRICFTSEGPEYWDFLAEGTRPFFNAGDPRRDLVAGDLGLVEELYRQYVDPRVVAADLVWPFDVASFDDEVDPQTGQPAGWRYYARKGTYNRFNRWNTTDGAMHLTHPANSLAAEVGLAGAATVLRRDDAGQPVTDPEEVVCCSGFGDPNRSSDPAIAAGVNGLARAGLSVSLADPVGVYVAELALDGFSGPDGEGVATAWQVDRGSKEQRRMVRARFEVPEELGFTVGQVLLDGDPIRFGGQVADRMQIALTGIAKQLVAGPVALRDRIVRCCPHPEKQGIEGVFASGQSCAALPPSAWERFVPALPGDPAPAGFGEEAASPFAAAAPADRLDVAVGRALTAEASVESALASRLRY